MVAGSKANTLLSIFEVVPGANLVKRRFLFLIWILKDGRFFWVKTGQELSITYNSVFILHCQHLRFQDSAFILHCLMVLMALVSVFILH